LTHGGVLRKDHSLYTPEQAFLREMGDMSVARMVTFQSFKSGRTLASNIAKE